MKMDIHWETFILGIGLIIIGIIIMFIPSPEVVYSYSPQPYEYVIVGCITMLLGWLTLILSFLEN